MIRAAIVAGGRGVRMKPLTDSIPKPMFIVGGKPLLEHQLEWLKASGVSEVSLCLGYKASAVSAHFGDGKRWGVTLDYSVESTPRGTAGCVKDLGARAGGDLLVIYGDLHLSMLLAPLLEFHRSHSGVATLVVIASDHPLDSDLVRLEGDRITGFYRAQPGRPYENWAAAAVWVVRPALLDLVPADRPSDFGRETFPAALAAGLELRAYRTTEAIEDLGTPERCERFLKSWEARRS